jgi:hypothetical protein
MPSGGTVNTVLSVFDHFTIGEILGAARPYAMSPVPRQGASRPKRTIVERLFGIRYLPHIGLNTTSIGGDTDRPIVERSWGLLSTIPSRKAESYGANFRWHEYYKTQNWIFAAFIHWGLALGGVILTILPPLRYLLKVLVVQPGDGPSRKSMAKEDIDYRGIAYPDSPDKTNKQVTCRAWYKGGMYSRKSPLEWNVKHVHADESSDGAAVGTSRSDHTGRGS